MNERLPDDGAQAIVANPPSDAERERMVRGRWRTRAIVAAGIWMVPLGAIAFAWGGWIFWGYAVAVACVWIAALVSFFREAPVEKRVTEEIGDIDDVLR